MDASDCACLLEARANDWAYGGARVAPEGWPMVREARAPLGATEWAGGCELGAVIAQTASIAAVGWSEDPLLGFGGRPGSVVEMRGRRVAEALPASFLGLRTGTGRRKLAAVAADSLGSCRPFVAGAVEVSASMEERVGSQLECSVEAGAASTFVACTIAAVVVAAAGLERALDCLPPHSPESN